MSMTEKVEGRARGQEYGCIHKLLGFDDNGDEAAGVSSANEEDDDGRRNTKSVNTVLLI
jgi:hypothetical protein